MENEGLYILAVIIAFVVIYFVVKFVIDHPIVLVFLLCAVLLVGSMYVYNYGDKNGDGVGDTQTIRMIQPSGNNVESDARYSKVNRTNAWTNFASALTWGVVMLVVLLFVVGIAFVWIALKSRG